MDPTSPSSHDQSSTPPDQTSPPSSSPTDQGRTDQQAADLDKWLGRLLTGVFLGLTIQGCDQRSATTADNKALVRKVDALEAKVDELKALLIEKQGGPAK